MLVEVEFDISVTFIPDMPPAAKRWMLRSRTGKITEITTVLES